MFASRRLYVALIAVGLLCGGSRPGWGQNKSAGLAEIAPPYVTLFVDIPNLQTTYTKYRATGLGSWLGSDAMKPFRASLAGTGAVSLCNLQGLFGFEEELLATFPHPAAVVAVPTPGAPQKGAVVLLIKVPGSDPAVKKALESAAKYHVANKAQRTDPKWPGADMALVYATPQPAPEPADEHAYFYSRGYFGIAGSAAAAQSLVTHWPTAEKSLAADADYKAAMAKVNQPGDLHWFARLIPLMEMFEEPPKTKRSRPWSLKLTNQEFTAVRGISGSVQLTTAQSDLEYTSFMLATMPLEKGARMMELMPGKALPLPTFTPANTAEFTWRNVDPVTQFQAMGNWFNELENAGKPKLFESVQADILAKLNVDTEKDLFGRMGNGKLRIVDVEGKKSAENPIGRRVANITQPAPAEFNAIRDTLGKMFDKDPDVTKEPLVGGKMWFVPPGQPLFMAGTNKDSSSINTAAILGPYVIFANDTNMVREFVKAQPFDPAAMAARTLEKRMAALETPQTGGRQVIHLEQSWQRPFEEMKAGNKVVDDYSSVRLLKLILTGDTSDKFAKQYSLLPPFTEAKKFLAPHGGVSDADPNGVLSRGFVLKGAAGK